MNYTIPAIIGLALALAAALIAPTYKTSPVGNFVVPDVFKLSRWAADCTSPCILPVAYVNGGSVQEFNSAAMILVNSNKKLVVTGNRCISACTAMVDTFQIYSPHNFCLETSVRMGFHRGSIKMADGVTKFADYSYSNPLIKEFITDNPLDLNGAVTFIESDQWGIAYPVCIKNYNIEKGLENK